MDDNISTICDDDRRIIINGIEHGLPETIFGTIPLFSNMTNDCFNLPGSPIEINHPQFSLTREQVDIIMEWLRLDLDTGIRSTKFNPRVLTFEETKVLIDLNVLTFEERSNVFDFMDYLGLDQNEINHFKNYTLVTIECYDIQCCLSKEILKWFPLFSKSDLNSITIKYPFSGPQYNSSDKKQRNNFLPVYFYTLFEMIVPLAIYGFDVNDSVHNDFVHEVRKRFSDGTKKDLFGFMDYLGFRKTIIKKLTEWSQDRNR